MTEQHRNWAGNYRYTAARLHQPTALEQVQDLVRSSRKVRALGTRHSFNDIADTPEDLISLEHFNEVIALDRDHNTVTVGAGTTYGRLGRYLHERGYAVHNLASLPHISVAGAVATATHGSGDGNGNLATAVAALEFVTASGDVVLLSRERDGDTFRGAVVALGGLGVVTKVTLDVEPAFDMRQDVYEKLPVVQLGEHFDAIETSAYSVSLFTDWLGDTINQVWLKSRVADVAGGEMPADLFGAVRATRTRHPLEDVPPENCTEQGGIPGPWHERLPHFRMEFTPSSGEELQTEYLVPRQHFLAAYHAIAGLRDHMSPLLQITEIRTIAADDLWMSPCYQQPCVGIHFTWTKDWPAVRKVLPLIEEQIAPFNARPHWGKLFTMQPDRIHPLFERLPDFRRLLTEYDPQGKFRNAFLDAYIFGTRLDAVVID